MPNRVIRGAIVSSESLTSRSLPAQLFFYKLILGCDDYGRTDARPKALCGLLYAIDRKVTPEDVEGWLAEVSTKLEDGDEPPVLIYQADGKPYLQMINWEKHRSDSRRGQKSRWPAPPGIEDAAATGVVYFVQSGADRIKIGYSEVLEMRLETLRTMVPDFKLLGTIDSPTRALEKKLHRKFAEFRRNGEWFEASPEILSYITTNAGRPAVSRDGTGRDGMGQDNENGPPGVSGSRGAGESGSDTPCQPDGRPEGKSPPDSNSRWNGKRDVQAEWAEARAVFAVYGRKFAPRLTASSERRTALLRAVLSHYPGDWKGDDAPHIAAIHGFWFANRNRPREWLERYSRPETVWAASNIEKNLDGYLLARANELQPPFEPVPDRQPDKIDGIAAEVQLQEEQERDREANRKDHPNELDRGEVAQAQDLGSLVVDLSRRLGSPENR